MFVSVKFGSLFATLRFCERICLITLFVHIASGMYVSFFRGRIGDDSNEHSDTNFVE